MNGPKVDVENLLASGSSSASSSSVPVEHMDYKYIKECKNVKELEKILSALRSGKEGLYPDLIQFCERRIEALDPKSKALQKDKPPASMFDVGKEDWQQINSDMKEWASEMGEESDTISGLNSDDKTLPPVRSHVSLDTDGKKSKNDEEVWGKPSEDRIKSSDYQAWDKFDADSEAAETDTAKGGDEKQPKVAPTCLTSTIDTEGMSDKEREITANKEKDKGNEAFKAGDYDEAVQYYTRSISVIPSPPAYNNRSLARIKLGQFIGAVEDCTKVLELEPENIKALLRRGMARKSLKEFAAAKEDLEAVLKAEPNNKQAKDLLADISSKKPAKESKPNVAKKTDNKPTSKGRRMIIEEVENDTDSEEEDDGKGQGSLVNGPENPENLSEAANEQPVQQQDNVISSSVAGEAVKEDDSKDSVATDSTLTNESPVSIATTASTAETGVSPNENSKPSVIEEMSLPTNDAISQNENVESSDTIATPPPPVAKPALPLPAKIVALKDSGNKLYKAGQYGEAMEIYSRAIDKILPEKDSFLSALATLYGNRAACHSKTGHLKEAIGDCDLAIDIQPYSSKVMMRRAAAYEGLEKYGHAYNDFQSAMQLDTLNQSAQTGATRMMRILSDQDGRQWRDNLPPMSNIQGMPRLTTLTPMARSNASASTGPSATSTTTTANKPNLAASVKPDQFASRGQDPKGQKVKGEGVKGQTAGAGKVTDGSEVKGVNDPMQTCDPNLSKEEKFLKLKKEGNALVQQGNHAGALAYYTACISLDPNQPVSYTNRALCFIKVHKGNEAESDCTQALELDDTNIKALYRRALARKMLNKFSDAARDLTSLLKIEPTNASAKKELDQVKEMWRQELKNNQKVAEKSKENAQPPPEVKQPKVEEPKVKPSEVKPSEVEPSEVEPEVKPEYTPSEVKPEVKPEGKPLKVKPEVKPEVKPSKAKPEVKPEVKPSEIKPEVKSSEVKPEVKPSEIKPEVKSSEIKPEVKSSEVKPSEVKSEKKKRKGKRMQIQEVDGSSEDRDKTIKQPSEPSEKGPAKEKKGNKTGSKKGGKTAGGKNDKVEEIPRETGSQKGGQTPGGDKGSKAPGDAGGQKGSNKTPEKQDDIRVPQLTKATAYEFLQAWTSLKHHKSMSAYAELLKQIEPKELPTVLTNKLDGDMLVIIVKAICEHLIDSDGDLSYGLLANLPKVERFKVMVLFFSTSDKKRLRNSLKKLGSRKSDLYTDVDLDKLRQQYTLEN